MTHLVDQDLVKLKVEVGTPNTLRPPAKATCQPNEQTEVAKVQSIAVTVEETGQTKDMQCIVSIR